MNLTNLLNTTLGRLVLFFVLYAVLAILGAVIVERSMSVALKSLKLALKLEFTSEVGRLNLGMGVLFLFAVVLFNLHQMLAESLKVEGTAGGGDHVIVPAVLVGLFFLGSLVCVMLLEKKK
jgi:hypothetical protein